MRKCAGLAGARVPGEKNEMYILRSRVGGLKSEPGGGVASAQEGKGPTRGLNLKPRRRRLQHLE